MPPSGYSDREVGSLREFLRSCSEALEREALGSGRTVEESLRREILQIGTVVGDATAFSGLVLRVTEQFYRDVLAALPGSDYRTAVRRTLDRFDAEVSSIHVPS
jgi:hypothetical protein